MLLPSGPLHRPRGALEPMSRPSMDVISVFVSVMVPDPGQRTYWTILISSPGSQVEVLVRSIHHIDSSRVAGVGMKDRAALVFAEHADPLTILHPVVCYDIIVELFSTLDLLRGKGCLIVKVEIARSRGEPLEAPSHLLFEQLDL